MAVWGRQGAGWGFPFSWIVFFRAEAFNFNEAKLSDSFFLRSSFCCCIWKVILTLFSRTLIIHKLDYLSGGPRHKFSLSESQFCSFAFWVRLQCFFWFLSMTSSSCAVDVFLLDLWCTEPNESWSSVPHSASVQVWHIVCVHVCSILYV